MAQESSAQKNNLKPVDPFALLERLRLTTGKAAEFCGVSRRQLCYWTDIGLVSALNEDAEEDIDGDDAGGRRVYDFAALYKIMLIKQVLSKVRSLRRAAKEIDGFLSQRKREAEELRASIDKKRETFLSEQSERLDQIAARTREKLTHIHNREDLFFLMEGLKPLDDMGRMISSGDVVLEEDPAACLRLATLIEQYEARLENLMAA